MTDRFPSQTDDWILQDAPKAGVVISSRARLARNLEGFPFAPRARSDQLAAISRTIRAAMDADPAFADFECHEIGALSGLERRFLRESHLISTDLEKGREHREVYIHEDAATSIMINEEDHLRAQSLLPGFQVAEVHEKIADLETKLETALDFAYDPKFGYLTACPTNTGTGLRVSVMVHLVGLVMTNQIEDALGSLGNFGLVVRGAYGENSSHAGDLFQISNEVTLGRNESNLVEVLIQVIEQVIEREMGARDFLFERHKERCADAVCRAIGLLRSARSMDSAEAVNLLSRLRLGLDRGFGIELTDSQLSRLLIDVQPAHLRLNTDSQSVEEGDIARASLLRSAFGDTEGENTN